MVLMSIISYLIWVLEIHFGLDEIQTSFILIVLIGIYIFFVLFTGKLVDRFGTKKVLLIGQAIIVCFGSLYFIVNLTNDLVSFLILNLISGLGFGMYETSGNTLLLKKIIKVNPNLKGGGFGINNMFGYFLSAIGPIILSLLGEISTFLPYYFITILVFVAFLIAVKFVKI
jgi:MFS family permease